MLPARLVQLMKYQLVHELHFRCGLDENGVYVGIAKEPGQGGAVLCQGGKAACRKGEDGTLIGDVMDMPDAVVEAGLANEKETAVGLQLVFVDFETEAAFADVSHGEVFCLFHRGGGTFLTLAQEVVYCADW